MLQTAAHTVDTDRGEVAARASGWALWVYRGWRRVEQVLCRVVPPANGLTSTCALKTLAKWIHPTRLETRTKESNIYASAKVANLCA